MLRLPSRDKNISAAVPLAGVARASDQKEDVYEFHTLSYVSLPSSRELTRRKREEEIRSRFGARKEKYGVIL